MTQPTVCAIMLTRDRPEMAARAVRCFRAQTYENKQLVIYDTGASPASFVLTEEIRRFWRSSKANCSIGNLRNAANERATDDPSVEIFIHWDDDDYSHPNRIAEQVALLQASKADCVGYREMLFWNGSEAIHYSHPSLGYALGTSLCYWRKTWEQKPFADLPKAKGGTGEDTEWLKGLNVRSTTSVRMMPERDEPRMIATIHGGNSQDYSVIDKSNNWRRAPEWDERVRKIMEGA